MTGKNAYLDIQAIIKHVLQNPDKYKGVHQESQERTTRGLAAVDPAKQMRIIWDAMCVYVEDSLAKSLKGVHIKKFGTFTFEPIVAAGLGNSVNPKGDRVALRPCWCPDSDIKAVLTKYQDKGLSAGPGSTFSKGEIACLNHLPIATGTYFNKRVVGDTLNAIASAIRDCLQNEQNIIIDCCFCKIDLNNRDVKSTKFREDFVAGVQERAQCWPKTKPTLCNQQPEFGGPKRISDTWKVQASNATAMFYPERPNSPVFDAMVQNTKLLKTFSLDPNSNVE